MSEEVYHATEPASPFRRRQVRRAGGFPRSTELSSVLLILAGLAVTAALFPSILSALSAFTIRMFSTPTPQGLQSPALGQYCLELLSQSAWRFVFIAGPACLILALAVFFSGLLQGRFYLSSAPLQFKFERLHIGNGLKRIFSLRSALRLIFNLLKIFFAGLVAFLSIRSVLPELTYLPALAPQMLLLASGRLALRIGLNLVLILTFLAVIDYVLVRYLHNRDLRMSTQQLRQEQRDLQGSPLTQQRRSDMTSTSPAQLAAAILQSDLILVDCAHSSDSDATRLAVALQRFRSPRSTEKASPIKLLVKGSGALAGQIHLLARQRALPIFNRPDLAKALARAVAVNHCVPLRLYPELIDLLARNDANPLDHKSAPYAKPRTHRPRRLLTGSLPQ